MKGIKEPKVTKKNNKYNPKAWKKIFVQKSLKGHLVFQLYYTCLYSLAYTTQSLMGQRHIMLLLSQMGQKRLHYLFQQKSLRYHWWTGLRGPPPHSQTFRPSISVFWDALDMVLWYVFSSQPFRPVFQFSLSTWPLLMAFWYAFRYSLLRHPLKLVFQFSISCRPFQMAFRDSLLIQP